jgi:hypothetical protein
MAALAEFDTTVTLCFTPPSRGKVPNCTSPPLDPSEFADFAVAVVERYAPPPSGKFEIRNSKFERSPGFEIGKEMMRDG